MRRKCKKKMRLSNLRIYYSAKCKRVTALRNRDRERSRSIFRLARARKGIAIEQTDSELVSVSFIGIPLLITPRRERNRTSCETNNGNGGSWDAPPSLPLSLSLSHVGSEQIRQARDSFRLLTDLPIRFTYSFAYLLTYLLTRRTYYPWIAGMGQGIG